MNRVLQAAVAVATFGLAAALAAPAQAQTSQDVLGEVTLTSTVADTLTRVGEMAGLNGLVAPVAGALGGTLDEVTLVEVTNLLDGGQGAARLADPVSSLSLVDGLSVPLLSGQDSFSETSFSETNFNETHAVDGVLRSVTDLVESLLGGDTLELDDTSVADSGPLADLVDSVSGTTDTLTETVRSTTDGLTVITEEKATVASLTDAVRLAIPQDGPLELAPLIGELSPAEAAPVVGSLPGVVDTASVDEIAPLVESVTETVEVNSLKVTGATTETLDSVTETTAAVTDLAAN